MPGYRSAARSVAAACAAVATLAAAGCASHPADVAGAAPSRNAISSQAAAGAAPDPGPAATRGAAVSPSPAGGSGGAPSTAACRAPDGFSCQMASRIGLARQYLAGRPGRIGLVLRDRQTGATWRYGAAQAGFPAASTIKLAMATDLLLRNGAGQIQMAGTEWYLLHHALHESDDHAADLLWSAFEDAGFLSRIRAFGMHGCYFTTPKTPYWGFMYCSPMDLDHLMNYVLQRIPAGARLYLTKQLQHVAPIQQWGVWGAGPRNHPGNKDGWEDDGGTWITNTVGFAGPRARYTLAIMYDSGGTAGFHYGATTLTQVAALLFQGHPGPAPSASATP